ncbi:YvrJ family protein [Paenibacillus tyrfis]|uniref:YvrJ family protein n=1 Tax=Paenibacillus tyrfis TaxID=1501230 RepID=UPI00209D0668|nr:YvrJ family protein [Paenibacillus tyrfis]MCP1311355.1 YvrJ family protein [Paenibacillus tyrfis]
MDQEVLTIFSTAVGNLGFPIVITGYLLLRFEKKMDRLNETIQELLKFKREEISRREGKV